MVILNTCCIRENADNRLYGHLGHLEVPEGPQPGMQIAVGGCLAQKDRELCSSARAAGRRGLRDPQPRNRPRPSAPAVGRGADRRDSGRARRRWATRRTAR